METWKSVVGYEGVYSVSNLGRVRRDLFKEGCRTFRQTGGLMGQHPIGYKKQYRCVRLCVDGRPKTVTTHSIVAAVFLGPRPEGKQINHKNGDPTDNRAENLEYVTASQNKLHSHYSLRKQLGENHYCAKLTEENVREIKSLLKLGAKITSIAKEFHVNPWTITHIKTGKNWKHVV